VREAVKRVDPQQPVFAIAAMPDLVRASVAPRRFVTTLLGAFALVALLLAVFGIHAVVTYSVLARRREIGIRMALGASASDVRRMVVIEGLSLVVAGAACGLLGAILLSGFLEAQLYEVSRADRTTYAGVVLLLVLTALAATATPAVRASRIDPIQALRTE
jgi:putative ABC transport system permease protein